MGAPDIRQLTRATAGREAVDRRLTPAQGEVFQVLYTEHFDFVFRNLRRLGVAASSAEDALQEVYLVVLRHLDSYRAGTHPKAWLFAITIRVARNYRRGMHRRRELTLVDADEHRGLEAGPFERVTRAEAREILHGFLDSISEAQRSVFVMAELEQMTAPEIAQALDANVNTVYARLRAARREFARMVASQRARQGGGE